jgi:hypothetical protein
MAARLGTFGPVASRLARAKDSTVVHGRRTPPKDGG